MARIPPDNEDDPQTSCAEFDHAGYEFEIEYPVNWKGTAELRFKNPTGGVEITRMPAPLAKKLFGPVVDGVGHNWNLLQRRAPDAPSGEAILDVLHEIGEMLIEKNRKYGNSALDPVRIFSDASPIEQIKIRIDDKLSRVKSGQADEDEPVALDLLGYLVLLLTARKREDST